MRSRIWLIVWFILVVVVIPTAAVMLALDTTATVPENQRISFDDVRRAQDLFARYDPRRMKPEEMTAINATAGELNTVIGATLSGLKHVRSHVIVDRAEVVIDVTLELPLPLNPLGRFVNLRAGIATFPTMGSTSASSLSVRWCFRHKSSSRSCASRSRFSLTPTKVMKSWQASSR